MQILFILLDNKYILIMIMTGFDLSNIDSLYVGSTEYSAIYLGSDLIWTKSYDTQYLTFTLLEPSQFAVIQHGIDLSDRYIAYSSDNGYTWTNIISQSGVTPAFPAGAKVIWKGNLSTLSNHTGSPFTFDNIQYVTTTGRFNVSGNISSLYFGDNFVNVSTTYPYMYDSLFSGCSQLISAKNLVLPALSLSDYCYKQLFYLCVQLNAAPELPATTLAESCYQNMFSNCFDLTTSPVLPAATLADFCYAAMFSGCSSLDDVTCLATDISARGCTDYWLYNVAASGTFTRDSNSNDWTIGSDGIPTGWTVVPPLPHNYSRDYLTFEALESGTFGWTDTVNSQSISYSTDDGSTWTTLTSGSSTPTIAANNKVIFKASGLSADTGYGIGSFSSTGRFNAMGNIMSLKYGDNFINQNTISNEQFKKLFIGCNKLVDASNLILPATTLTTGCYSNMFQICTSLTTAPALPATSLASSCYSHMFDECTSLTTAPVLPATTLAGYCYAYMFSYCSSLNTAPSLPATTLAGWCYRNMFESCTSLTTAPALPATTLFSECYEAMFNGCTSLTTAPALPATTLAISCYQWMFNGCTSLTTAPALPATTLVEGCYLQMFTGCTSLSSITCYATDISAIYCTASWLASVAASGTFTRDSNMTDWTIGASGIPTGWTVVPPLTHDYSQDYLTLEALEAGTFTWTDNVNHDSISYSTDNGSTWNTLASGNSTPTIAANSKVLLKANLGTGTVNGNGTISSSGNFNAMGNIMSMQDGDNFVNSTTISNSYQFSRLFRNCTKLVDASNLILPATTLVQRCYYNMFNGCSSLTAAPELPATTLQTRCYLNMFSGCTSLTSAPALPATTIADACYSGMFSGCTSLTSAPALPATTLYTECYSDMFRNCTSLITAPELPATISVQRCYENMFNGCSSLNYIKCLLTNLQAYYCTNNWVSNVAASGTFVKANGYGGWGSTRGPSAIPSGWTVVDAS